MNQIATRSFVLLALLADVATLILLLLIVPRAAEIAAEPSGTNTLLLVAVYVAFLIGTFMLRKCRPTPPATGVWLSPVVRSILAGFFGLVLTLIISWQLGFFESFDSAVPMVLGEGEAAAYFVFAPGAWMAVSMLYILFLAFPVNEAVSPSEGRYSVFTVIGLITHGLLLVAVVAQGQAFVPPSNTVLWFVVGLAVLLLMFLPPRLLYASRFTEIRIRSVAIMLASLSIVCAVGAWLLATP